MSRKSILCLLAGLAVCGVAGADEEEEAEFEYFDRTPQDCVQVSRIRRTEVVDGRTILFYMRGGAIYLNHMPRECPGLEREERFMYRTTGGQLCAIDSITVLERFGAGLDRGFTCRLGQFYPMTQEEVEELKLGPSNVETIPVEPDDDESD